LEDEIPCPALLEEAPRTRSRHVLIAMAPSTHSNL